MRMNETPWLIIDGRNLLWRAAQANESLTARVNGKRIRTGGIHGFLMSLVSVRQRYGGRVIIAWEGTDNFRFKLFPQYKPRGDSAEREEWVRILDDQQERLKCILSCAGVAQYTGVDCEADDVIATIAELSEGPVLIYTMDSDLRQCVNKRVKVISAGFKGDVFYDVDQVVKRHGVKPSKIPDLKALAGDHSDGIPGVKGIGEKTAVALLSIYGTVEEVRKAAFGFDGSKEWPVATRFIKSIRDIDEKLIMYKKLTTVLRDVEIREVPIARSRSKLTRKLLKYRLRTLSFQEKTEKLLDLAW